MSDYHRIFAHKSTLGLIALVALIGVACASPIADPLPDSTPRPASGASADSDTEGEPHLELADTRWVLDTLHGEPALSGTRVTLIFEDGLLGGYAGCNDYGGPAEWYGDGTFRVDEIAMTQALCGDPEGVMEQENAYVAALNESAAYYHHGSWLELFDESGTPILTFKPDTPADMNPADLVDTHWELVTMNGVAPLEGSTLTFNFETEGRFSGHAGCRDFEGDYIAEGDTIVFPSFGMTGDDSCLSDEALFTQEHDYISYIEESRTWSLDGDTLELYTRRDEVLEFRRGAAD